MRRFYFCIRVKTQLINNVNSLIGGVDSLSALSRLSEAYPGQVAFSTSFGWEDQLISHLIFSNNLSIRVFTLDTGRMFPETYNVWNRTLERYKQKIEVFSPEKDGLQKMIELKGPNSFYQSIENRKECCFIRKVEPLGRALSDVKVWITGIRAEQSINRTDMSSVEWDEGHQLVKFHPLFDWTLDEVKEQISIHNIPYNVLHDKGFPSIGCAPCTRAIQPGDDFRAGRWWWEDTSKKECGLHAM